ncbi:MAG: TIGR04283 family arsenosugar biosynthesis glycosyltransferase [Candidatus Omnitrophica bacterium]|nr:TIGR04283 family arsenosugar biosynthesis glycosyltransferase [Candidatus Omnitrophota bacterium]
MISVIVPTFNEERNIRRILELFSQKSEIELIIVDGESQDQTSQIVADYPCLLIKTQKKRAYQLNKGAQRAKGDILIFLHADCLIDDYGLAAIKAAIDQGCIGGALSQKIEATSFIYRYIEFSGNLRAKLTKIFYGDQAIFVRKDIFNQIGGFEDVDLFDDVLFSKKLKKTGRTCLLNNKVYTLPRRWQKQGIIKTTIINWLISFGFIFKIPIDKLKNFYDDLR